MGKTGDNREGAASTVSWVNTASYRLEGQDASNGQVPATQAQVQPSVDGIQEVTVQTSNFAAEYVW